MSETEHPTPLSLADLADRCKAAEYPIRTLDGLIFITVTPGVADAGRIDQIGGVVGWWPKDKPYQSAREVPRYTFSLDAALSLVPADHWWECVQTCAPDSAMRNFGTRSGMFTAKVGRFQSGSHNGVAHHDNPVIAVCMAALLARSLMVPSQDGATP